MRSQQTRLAAWSVFGSALALLAFFGLPRLDTIDSTGIESARSNPDAPALNDVVSTATDLESASTEAAMTGRRRSMQMPRPGLSFDPPKLAPFVKKSLVSMLLVMLVGGVVVMLCGRWTRKSAGGGEVNPLQIVATLGISPRGRVQILQADQHRLLVATDATGVRSVVLLPQDFSDTLQEQQDTVPVDDPVEPTSTGFASRPFPTDSMEMPAWAPQHPTT